MCNEPSCSKINCQICSAWARGHYAGMQDAIEAINKVLDRFDSGVYDIRDISGYGPLNRIYLRMGKLYTKDE